MHKPPHPPPRVRARRLLKVAGALPRAAKRLAGALADPYRPLLAQMIVTRRCNLACAYCNEYDKTSPPVPFDELRARIGQLAALNTAAVGLTGGEPMLHPELPELVAEVRRQGMFAGMITNGYFLRRDRIEALNTAGLDHLQISIDNLEPDESSRKSLRLLERKLALLAEHAIFYVNVTAVLGANRERPEEALVVLGRARSLGLGVSLNVTHDGDGQLIPLSSREREVQRRFRRMRRSIYVGRPALDDPLAERGLNREWRCRAGARYLYICEEGRVHYCSQQRGRPGLPLAEYGRDELRRAFHTAKACAPRCTIGCVHDVSVLDQGEDQRPPERPETGSGGER